MSSTSPVAPPRPVRSQEEMNARTMEAMKIALEHFDEENGPLQEVRNMDFISNVAKSCALIMKTNGILNPTDKREDSEMSSGYGSFAFSDCFFVFNPQDTTDNYCVIGEAEYNVMISRGYKILPMTHLNRGSVLPPFVVSSEGSSVPEANQRPKKLPLISQMGSENDIAAIDRWFEDGINEDDADKYPFRLWQTHGLITQFSSQRGVLNNYAKVYLYAQAHVTTTTKYGVLSRLADEWIRTKPFEAAGVPKYRSMFLRAAAVAQTVVESRTQDI